MQDAIGFDPQVDATYWHKGHLTSLKRFTAVVGDGIGVEGGIGVEDGIGIEGGIGVDCGCCNG